MRREELVSDVEYKFALALNKGDYYLGQAKITFYLKSMPANDDELFLNFQTKAVSNLMINDHVLTD